ncbi:MAG: sulfotransferase [Cytophagales bacterium]|nr:sulfotransferase [Cytophagales bacterium]
MNYAIIVYQNALKKAFSSKVNNKYLFVLEATHGGTTELTELLSTSEHVSSNNYLHTREGQLLPTVIDHMFTHGQQWEEDLEIDWHFVKQEWRKYWDVRKCVLLEKSPTNLLRARAIEAVFEPAYFLVFVRDPYAHCETFIRKNDFTPRQTAEFVIRMLKVQQRNLKELDRALLLHYETLVQDPETFKKRLTAFLGELSDIETGGIFYAHNHYQQPLGLKNFNQEKIDRLSASAISEINEVFGVNEDLLQYFGYRLQS